MQLFGFHTWFYLYNFSLGLIKNFIGKYFSLTKHFSSILLWNAFYGMNFLWMNDRKMGINVSCIICDCVNSLYFDTIFYMLAVIQCAQRNMRCLRVHTFQYTMNAVGAVEFIQKAYITFATIQYYSVFSSERVDMKFTVLIYFCQLGARSFHALLKRHFSCEFYLLAHYSPIWPIQGFESWFINRLIFNMILKPNSSFNIHYCITRDLLISELKVIATPNWNCLVIPGTHGCWLYTLEKKRRKMVR